MERKDELDEGKWGFEYNSRRTRGAEVYRRQCQNGCRYSPLCANEEVAKSRRTGITSAYTQDMLYRERTMDCIMHYWY